MKKSILVIPHIHSELIRNRGKEIAQQLASKYDVHYLRWHSTYSKRLLPRVKTSLVDIFKISKKSRKGNMSLVDIPILHRPLAWARHFNRYSLAKYMAREEFDVLINASIYSFSVPKNRDFKYIFDFVDLPWQERQSPFGEFVYRHCLEETSKADTITAVSQGLCDFVANTFGRKAHLLPNGTGVSRFREVKKSDVEELRRKHGLTGKFIFGCIGNWGPWMNLGRLIKVFQKLNTEMRDAVLLLIGPGKEIEFYQPRIKDKAIIFMGAVPPEDIERYFCLLDVSILPKVKNEWQDMAFHIKIIEYTAARKIIVSTPLTEIKRLNFPNIIFPACYSCAADRASQNEEEWVNALKTARKMQWQREWDKLVEKYDWEEICGQLGKIIEAL